jgi:pimeloyl-ACP methyl ester carboxylesterase
MHSRSWFCRQTGSGRPLVLLHGIGMSHTAWTAITPHLSPHRRLIAFDIAGFGRSPALATVTPTVENLVDALEDSLRALDVPLPVDMAGNSLGGCLALEAARRRIARRVVALSPIGLWREHEPRHVKHVFGCLRWTALTAPHLLKAAMRLRWLRAAGLAVPLSIGSSRMPGEDAMRIVDELAGATAFEQTFVSTRAPFSGRDIVVPVTVVFGERDWILTASARLRDALPSHATWIAKPGWGHVPMWIDPAGVARLLLDATR